MKHSARIATLALAASVLFGCGTSLGGILGGDDDDRSTDTSTGSGTYGYDDEIRGTVERVDTMSRVIVVNAENGYRNDLRNDGDGDRVEISYDDRTVVAHDGRTYQPNDLERGDRVVIDVARSGDRLIADKVDVTYDATPGGSSDRTAADLRGTVRYIDTRDRTVEVDPIGDDNGYASGRDGTVLLHYDDATDVEYDGRRYEVSNLERGDEIDVEIRQSGSRLIAEEIVVVRDQRTSSSNY